MLSLRITTLSQPAGLDRVHTNSLMRTWKVWNVYENSLMWTWTSKRPLRLIDPSAGSRQQSRIIISCSKFNWNGRLVFLLLLPCLWCLPLMDHTFVIHTFYSKVAHGADCQDNLSLDLGIPTTIFLPQYLEIIWYLNPRGKSNK